MAILGEVLVLDEEGHNLGKMLHKDALILASNRNLDLVLINKNENNQVYKIMDHGRWKYHQNKNKPKKNHYVMKEINCNVMIDPHDLGIKVNHIKEFLLEGLDVKISILMKGREKANPFLANQKMDSVLNEIKDLGALMLRQSSSFSVSCTLKSNHTKDHMNANSGDKETKIA